MSAGSRVIVAAAALMLAAGGASAQEGKGQAIKKLIASRGMALKEAAELFANVFVEKKAAEKKNAGFGITTRHYTRMKNPKFGDGAMLLLEFRCSGRLYGLMSYEAKPAPHDTAPINEVLKSFIALASEIPDMSAQWTLYRRTVHYQYQPDLNGIVITEFMYKIQRRTLGLGYRDGREDPRFLRDSRHFMAFPAVRKTYYLPSLIGESEDREIVRAKANAAQKKIIALFERDRVFGSTVLDVAVCAADGKHKPKAVRGAVQAHQTPKAMTKYLAAVAEMALARTAKAK